MERLPEGLRNIAPRSAPPPNRWIPSTSGVGIGWVVVLIVLVLLCTAARSQVVHVGNSSTTLFDGWKRCTVDREPPHEAGEVEGLRYVLGRRIGRDLRAIDLRVRLQPGQTITVDLSRAAPWPFVRPQLPADPVAMFGDGPWLGSSFLAPVMIEPDGAAWASHWRGRIGRMFCADLWCLWYPGQPWCPSELLLVASNPAVPDMTAEAPAGLVLRFGSAVALVPGRGTPDPVVPAGTSFGDGQGKACPATLLWRGRASQAELASAAAEAGQHIHAIGCARVWPEGNPTATVSISPASWIAQHRAGSIARLHSWEAGMLGPVANSTQAGHQEDQVWVGVECSQGAASLGAETVRYLVAMALARQPAHHREADGQQVDLLRHPQLRFWNSRTHEKPAVSPDRLGKPRPIAAWGAETNGWIGPDSQHRLHNTMTLATRLTGSRACGYMLAQHARNFLLQDTVDAAVATSTFDSARSVGWSALLVGHLDAILEDRLLATRVIARWHDRVRMVYVPQLGQQPGAIWDPRPNSEPFLARTWASMWMTEQQALGAGLLYLTCVRLGPPEGVQLGLQGCRAVLERAWTQQAGQWIGWERLAYLGADSLPAAEVVEGRGAHRTGWYERSWFVPAIAALRLADPTNERVRAIWQQHGALGGTWTPPGVR